MFINKLRVNNFRNIKNPMELDFKPGITLVKARNEGGKSTVRSAINIALYGDPRSSSQVYKELKTWGEDDMYEISIEFEVNGEKYNLVRDFGSKISTLVKVNNGKKYSDRKKISEVLSDCLGLPSAVLFRNTACFSAEELSYVKNTEDLRKRLEEKLSGVEGVSVAVLVSKIEKELAYLRKGLKRHADEPGPIKRYKDKNESLKNTYKEMESEINSSIKSLIRFNEVSAQITELHKTLEIKQKAYEKCSEYKKAKETHNRAVEKFKYFTDSLEERTRLAKKSDKLGEQATGIKERGLAVRHALNQMEPVLEAEGNINITKKQLEALKVYTNDIHSANKQLEDGINILNKTPLIDKDDLTKVESLNNQINSLKLAGQNQGFNVDIKALGDISPEIVVDQIPQKWVEGVPVNAGAELLVTLPGVAELRIKNKNTQAAENIKNERKFISQIEEIFQKYNVKNYNGLQGLIRNRDKAEQVVKQKESALEALLKGKDMAYYRDELQKMENMVSNNQQIIEKALPGIQKAMKDVEPDLYFPRDIVAFIREKKPQYEQLRQNLLDEFNDINTPYQRVIGELNKIPPKEELEAGRKDWANAVFIAETALEKIAVPEMDIEQITMLEQEIENLNNQVNNLTNERHRLEAQLSSNKYGIEDLENLQDDIEHNEKLLTEAISREQVLLSVRKLFEEARNNTLIKMAESMGDQVIKYFKELTEGRYQRVEINPAGLDIRVFADEKGDYLDIDRELSTGTRDQIYLAARLAMIPAASNGRKPPLLLDDSLVNFDKGRRDKAFKLFKDLSKEHQVIIFSCHDYYDNLADHILKLSEMP